MSARKIIREHCEHEWEFSCHLDGRLFTLSLSNLNFIEVTPKQKEELFARLSEALK